MRILFLILLAFSSLSYSDAYISKDKARIACISAFGSVCGEDGFSQYYFYDVNRFDGSSYQGPGCTVGQYVESCSIHVYSYDNTGSCPEGTIEVPETGLCGPDCQPGSLSPDCSTYCPLQDYTYTLNGVVFRGKVGGGTVGYGQPCPEPSYPEGSESGCVGDVGSCGEDWENGTNDGVPVTTEETTTETTENPDGSSTTTETTTTNETGGESASGSSGSSDGSAIDDQGNALPDDDNPTNDWDGLQENTVDIGGSTYGLCSHGGIVSADGGCDYPTHNCTSRQVDSASGCVDLPDTEPLPSTEPTTTTTTNTDPEGNSTTTTISIPGSDGTGTSSGTSTGEGETTETPSTGSASSDCTSPPVSSGDAQLDAILQQNWNLLCAGDTFAQDPLGDMGDAVTEAEDELIALIDSIKTDISNTVGVNLSLSGSCSENMVTIFAVSMDFSVCRFIPYFAIAGNVLLAMGAFISFRIIMS